MAAKAELKFRVPARNVKAVASWHVPGGKLGGRSDSAGARPACRSGRERSSHHGRQKRALAYARRRLKPKNGGFWSAQFCTEVAHPTRFERAASSFGGWRSIQLSYGCISVAYAVLTRISCECEVMNMRLASP